MQQQIEKGAVRRFLVARQGFDRRATLDEWCARLPDRLGCIQYDPLNVVGRNHDLVLQSRVEGYRAGDLYGKTYGQRTLIDGWDKMMSLIHARDWPRFARLRADKETEYRAVMTRRGSVGALEKADWILRELRERGPLRGDEIDLGKVPAGGWGHRNAAGAVLEYLFVTGAVGVSAKTGTRKTFDLIERLLPADILREKDPFGSDEAYHKWLVLRRVRAVGALWNKGGVLWQGIGPVLSDGAYRQTLFDSLTAEGALRSFTVNGIARPLYAAADEFADLESARDEAAAKGGSRERDAKEARILAPLDNLLWERELIAKLFDFAYSWEVYLPKEKRAYGYYVLPVLWGNDLAARIEPAVSKERGRATVLNLWLEPWLDGSDRAAFMEALRLEFARFAAYLGLEPDALPPPVPCGNRSS